VKTVKLQFCQYHIPYKVNTRKNKGKKLDLIGNITEDICKQIENCRDLLSVCKENLIKLS